MRLRRKKKPAAAGGGLDAEAAKLATQDSVAALDDDPRLPHSRPLSRPISTPWGSKRQGEHEELDPATYGFYRRGHGAATFTSTTSWAWASTRRSQQILDRCRATYCGSIRR